MFAALQPWHCSILLLSSDENKAGPDYSTSQQEWAEQCLATACMMSARTPRVGWSGHILDDVRKESKDRKESEHLEACECGSSLTT